MFTSITIKNRRRHEKAMARRKIREFDAKRLIAENIASVQVQNVLVAPDTDLDALPQSSGWLKEERLVVKPDQLFGRRKKLGLVLADVDFDAVQKFINLHRNKPITIGNAMDRLSHFLIEPFIPHQEEYYLSITSERDGDRICFSPEGGMDIEENWHKVKKLFIPTLGTVEGSMLDDFIGAVPEGYREILSKFIKELHAVFVELNFTFLELNPFVIHHSRIYLLDAVAIVDDCAAVWKEREFPKEFGKQLHPEEEFIADLDKESGASLKLTLLNPHGRIWNILSGGGASIIYLDAIADAGKQEEIANYGEYSGNPTTEESYQYAKTILELMTQEQHHRGKVLIIGGAIANFTDVEKTFSGIIKALREYREKLRAGNISIFVRRGGPHYEQGLKLMKQAGQEMNIPMLVQGPETPMVKIVENAMGG